MRIISWNTNGLRATVRQGFFFPLFEKYDPDISCPQETKSSPEQLTEDTKNIPGYTSHFSSCETKKGYSGVAIYVRNNSKAGKPVKIFHGMAIKRFDQEGRIVGVKFKNFTLINIYFPNGGQGPHRLEYKMDFYAHFLKFIMKLRNNGEKVIFCGDVNTAHEEIDLARPKENVKNTGFLPEERAWIDEVIKNNFLDVWREKYPNKKEVYTYWDQKTRARDRNVGWRIDYFFAEKKIFPKIKSAKIHTNYMGSDHCPIEIEIL